MMATIDPKKPVRLIRLVSHQGNFYHPRMYQPGELPDELLVEGIVTQEVAITEVLPIQNYASAIQVQEVKIETGAAIPTPVAYPGEKPLVISTSAKIEINRANADILSTLPNVGPATAMKLTDERDKGKFTDVKNLSDRVPLARGSWEELSERLLFD